MTTKRSRLAPSPTGSLHLGNCFAFLVNWAFAKKWNWELIMRIEDLDGPRKKIETIDETIDILRWIGIDWDGNVHIQSQGLQYSREILMDLIDIGCTYHCNLSRSELQLAASAPHTTDRSLVDVLRPKDVHAHNASVDNVSTNWRFMTKSGSILVNDELFGEQTFDGNQDFIIWTKNDLPSYQLAVVVDDHRHGITDVVRGNDLLQSAAWQEQIYEAMEWTPPRWWHLPLIVGEDGKRLAKRHGDSRLSSYRAQGVQSERIIGLVATWCGIQENRAPMSKDTFCRMIDHTKISSTNIVYTKEDEQWLLD